MDDLRNRNVLETPSPLHGTEASAPYPLLDALQLKRLAALNVGTTYCYDFLLIIEKALAQLWREYDTARGGSRYVS